MRAAGRRNMAVKQQVPPNARRVRDRAVSAAPRHPEPEVGTAKPGARLHQRSERVPGKNTR